MRYLILIIAFYFQRGVCFSQDFPRQEINFQQVLDDIVGPQGEDANEEQQENLMQYLSHPLDLNIVTAEELKVLHVLSDEQIQNLLHYRSTHGDFISIYELQAIPGMQLSDVYRLVPFVTAHDPASMLNKNLFSRMRDVSENYFLVRYSQLLQEKDGFASGQENTFRGSPAKVYVRCRASKPGDFSFGFTLEKDEGEKLEWNPSHKIYGFDYISFHGQLLNKKRIVNLIVGDFQGQFGQGLTLGISGVGKGGETITSIRRSNIGFAPYTSAYEVGGFRGVAGTIKLTDRFHVSTFLAMNYRDGSFTNDSVFSSLQTTGLHRNTNELEKRKTIREQNAGLIFQYHHGQLDGGVIFHYMQYAQSLQRKASPYNQFAFGGADNLNTGFYLNYSYNNFSFFSEFSKSVNGGAGFIGGLLGSLSNKFDLAFAIRNYDQNFHTLYGNALSENTVPQNEQGVYWGWKYRWNRKYSFSGYVDLFRFPWLRFRSYRPSVGHEWLFRFDYQPSRKMLLSFQTRTEIKDRNASDETPLYYVNPARKKNFLLGAQYGIGQKLRLKTRIQYSEFKFAERTTSGVCLMQDVMADVGRFKVNLRYAIFDTDDYDNRQYAYENDVWLAYSLPAYDGRGIRKVAVIHYKLNRSLGFWLRFSRTRYADRDSSGSGLDTVGGNIRDEIKLQAMYRF